jgi:hypothetical protein
LFSEGDNLQMSHQLISQERIRLSMIRELLKVVVVLVESGQHVLIKIFSLLLKLGLCQVLGKDPA